MNQALCRDSPDPELLGNPQEPPLGSLSPRMLTTMDYDQGQGSKKHAWMPSKTSGEDTSTERLPPHGSRSPSQTIVFSPLMMSKAPMRDISQSSTATRMSCAQRARRLVQIERSLSELGRKIALGTKVRKKFGSKQKNDPNVAKGSLLGRMSMPGSAQNVAERTLEQERTHSERRTTRNRATQPALLSRLTSPPRVPLLERLTAPHAPNTVTSELSSTSGTSIEPHRRHKRKGSPNTSDEPTSCSVTGRRTSRRLSGDMSFLPAGPSSRLQSLRISSADASSTLMRYSPTTTPHS